MWILFSFLTALFEASKDGLCKRSLRDVDPYIVAWSWKALSVPFVLPTLLFVPWPRELASEFWIALAVGGGLNVLATFMYVEAIRISDLSITLPLLSFTPVFLLGTSPLLVADYPGLLGGAGVLLIFSGTYILNVREVSAGYLAPMQALLRDRGARIMLGVAAIWSICANMDKIGVLESNPFFWSLAVQLVISAGLTLVILLRRPASFVSLRTGSSMLGLIGLASAAGLLCQMQAVMIGLVPYVISIKRTSVLLGVLSGGIFFREQDMRSRLLGASVMVAGVFCISLS
jgi:uncharacterized membrane protein